MNTPQETLQEALQQDVPPKAYRSPQLIEYGALHQITKSFGNMGNKDGGASKNFDRTAA